MLNIETFFQRSKREEEEEAVDWAELADDELELNWSLVTYKVGSCNDVVLFRTKTFRDSWVTFFCYLVSKTLKIIVAVVLCRRSRNQSRRWLRAIAEWRPSSRSSIGCRMPSPNSGSPWSSTCPRSPSSVASPPENPRSWKTSSESKKPRHLNHFFFDEIERVCVCISTSQLTAIDRRE